jgi:predicted DNA-binding antitoxin AbrB/MazE fold protein
VVFEGRFGEIRNMSVIIEAIYKDGVFHPTIPVEIPDNTRVRITLKKNFSDLIEEYADFPMKESADTILEVMRRRVTDK